MVLNYCTYNLKSPPDFGYYGKWVVMPTTRKGIHVGNLTYNNGDAVENHLLGDIMKSVKPWLAEVMDKVKVGHRSCQRSLKEGKKFKVHIYIYIYMETKKGMFRVR